MHTTDECGVLVLSLKGDKMQKKGDVQDISIGKL